MIKCKKIKNPCKICLGPVSQKNGLQCHGACESWVHYACLNYTPGRISDIKKGIIVVNCPCPDCKTTQPKEYRTDQAFSCDNSHCPANHPPKCVNMACPTNKGTATISNAPTCPIGKCGKGCKKHSHPQTPDVVQPATKQPCVPPQESYNDVCISESRCPSGCNASSDIPGDMGTHNQGLQSMDVVEQMVNTVGQLTNQINELLSRMKHLGTNQGGNGCGPNNSNCPQQGPKSHCPKPCNCPGNPRHHK